MASLKLGWYSLSAEGDGYSYIGRMLHAALKNAGATLLPPHLQGWDAMVYLSPPAHAWMIGNGRRDDVVFHTMIECDEVPDGWVNILNNARLVWTPSAYCTDVFRASGVTTPIETIPYGFDSAAYPCKSRVVHERPLRVLAWGDMLHSRKNLLLAIEAFQAAELGDAELEIKVNMPGILPEYMQWHEGNVVIFNGYWTHDRLLDWLYSGDVGMYLSGGEGYGMMPRQMIATGLPLISVVHTGIATHIDPADVLFVPVRELRPSPYFQGTFQTPALERVPDLDAVVMHLRWADTHRDALSARGVQAAKHVHTAPTWDSVGRDTYSMLQHYFS